MSYLLTEPDTVVVVASRDEAAGSSILRTLLAEGEMTIFADVPYTPDPDEVRGETDLEAFGDHYPEAAREAHEDDLQMVETEKHLGVSPLASRGFRGVSTGRQRP
ncbi:hypothetical protein BRC67_04370 [Halobacteriales archaeon QH_3_68_24]|nr:MAG: hypothetical protein BRC74_06660 [Halobacteriales archaeon QH_7_68_42]PSP52451.1 MAG: hypothetical protein BRC67_04370 [Halobacteriales archaeon QH_3_68_24]